MLMMQGPIQVVKVTQSKLCWTPCIEDLQAGIPRAENQGAFIDIPKLLFLGRW